MPEIEIGVGGFVCLRSSAELHPRRDGGNRTRDLWLLLK